MTTFSETFNPTSLICGQKQPVARDITLHGATAMVRGQLLGRKSIGTASVAAHSGNTGNGTLTMDGTTPLLPNNQSGIYDIAFTSATAYSVFDPEGHELGQGVNGTAFANQLKFNSAAGGTAFVAGDSFQITVAASDIYTSCVQTAIDGSQQPVAVLAADADPSAGDIPAPAYFEGEFAGEMMTFDSSWTDTTIETALRQANSGLYVRSIGELG